MKELAPSSALINTFNSTYARRSLIRNRLARGKWWECEPDTQRLAAFQSRRKSLQVNGDEVLQGETSDYQGSAFLAIGAQTRRAIAYVEINLPNTFLQATGFLIGGGLFITNNHVIRHAEDALNASVFFDRELDRNRQPLETTAFRLDPTRFFVSSPPDKLDYTLVALGERITGNATLSELGSCPLSPMPDKHILGMNINIVQHPKGQYKQVAIRNNLLTYRTQNTLLYETDTEVGSSGSPVFNDMWELVALHHSGEPYLANTDIPDPINQDDSESFSIYANEGIRASVIHESLTQILPTLSSPQHVLLEVALDLYRNTALAHTAASGGESIANDHSLTVVGGAGSSQLQRTASMNSKNVLGQAAITVPLEITVHIGGAGLTDCFNLTTLGTPIAELTAKPVAPRLYRASESVRVDVNYANRSGYKSNFIEGFEIPLPNLSEALAGQLAPLRVDETADNRGVLDYEHFSLTMHKTRRVAIYTATNIDGGTYLKVNRKTGQIADSAEGDTWYKDPRISESFWLGQDFYSNCSDYFDKGHLTRRADPSWGAPEEAARANADTFHFTNCSPQHFRFNQSAQYWQGAERYVLETGLLGVQGIGSRLIVMQGPIYNDEIDLWIDNEIQIPSSFWKIVIWKGRDNLKSVGLVVDQLELLSETRRYLGQPNETPAVNVSQWRVHVADIAKRTDLIFPVNVIEADTIGQPIQPQPSAEVGIAKRINALSDIIL